MHAVINKAQRMTEFSGRTPSSVPPPPAQHTVIAASICNIKDKNDELISVSGSVVKCYSAAIHPGSRTPADVEGRGMSVLLIFKRVKCH